MSSFKSCMGETLDIIHLGAKSLFIYGPVKLENKLSTSSKIQWWARDVMTVINIPIPKAREEIKSHWSQARSKPSSQILLDFKAWEYYSVAQRSALWSRSSTIWIYWIGLCTQHSSIGSVPRSSSISLWFCDCGGSVGLYFFVPVPSTLCLWRPLQYHSCICLCAHVSVGPYVWGSFCVIVWFVFFLEG